jgi:MFS family permease
VNTAAQRGIARPAKRAAEGSLDWLNLFAGDIQTGFGPFVAIYLTNCGWSETTIGLALSLGTVAAMASQIPAGALVDAIRHKACVVLLSIVSFRISALLFAVEPAPPAVYVAEILHSFSSCALSSAIAAISLAVLWPARQRSASGLVGTLALPCSAPAPRQWARTVITSRRRRWFF